MERWIKEIEMKPKKIIGIKCKSNDKTFITEFLPDDYNKYKSLNWAIINGEDPVQSFNKNWNIINDNLKTLQRKVKQDNINQRFVLIDPSIESEKFPLTIKAIYNKTEYHWEMEEKYNSLYSLYKLESDKQPDIIEDVPFEYKEILEVEELKDNIKFPYKVSKSKWSHQGLRDFTHDDIEYQLIDKIMFPDIVLPLVECKLSAENTYKIIKQYIKQHINYDYATITSDYDFCFTVKKKIKLSEIETFTIDVNNNIFSKKKKKPKYETKYRKYREIECFNMTPSNYNDYKQVKEFRGDSQEDLKNKIDNYCKALINYINEPVLDCPHCSGRGVKEVKLLHEDENLTGE
jgi:hypothetical protein